MSRTPPPCLASIHDVMPETLDRVQALRERLARAGAAPVTLFVVPGRSWQPRDVDRLHAWVDDGCTLAAHGWHHRVERLRGLRARVHSLLLSRDAGEHLGLDADGIASLLERAAAWFASHGLAVPSLYVPPAWALGDVRADALAACPFERIEVLRGVLDARTSTLTALPLVGFEADTRLRSAFLGSWNALQVRRARRLERPLRLGLHPDDLRLRLRDQLERIVDEPWRWMGYDELPAPPRAGLVA